MTSWRILLAASLVICLRPSAAAGGDAPGGPAGRRPRVGLALGGGAARGLAHVGVLQWLEEHRVPVDVVAGTSVGGLVGGAYATGMPVGELRDLVRATDWEAILLSDSRFADKTFRRKQDKRAYPSRLELGLAHGLTLPRGINPGQPVGLLLDRLALPYYDLQTFDDLPTPFRCLAMDLIKARAVVLEKGVLSQALRATMAIPGVFTPVRLGEWLLVDGGTVAAVPGVAAREMGADIVIAVDVSAGSQGDVAARLRSGDLLTILDRTVDAMMAAGARTGIEAADLVIVPDLSGLDAMAWQQGEELRRRGYAAAEAAEATLLRFAVSEDEYAAYLASRASRRRVDVPRLHAIVVAGVGPFEQSRIREALADSLGRRADPPRIERGIARIAGSDRYERIDYRILAAPAGAELLVEVEPKAYGPPFLALGLDVNNVDANHVAANLSARLIRYDTLGLGSEVRDDVVVGSRQQLSREIIKPLGRSPVFVAPRASVSREDRDSFEGRRLVAQSRLLHTAAGLDLGVLAGRSTEVRMGVDGGYLWSSSLVGAATSPPPRGRDGSLFVRLTMDRQDGPVVPSRGLFVKTTARRYLASPQSEGRGSRRFWQAESSASFFQPVGAQHRLFAQLAGGSSFGARPGFNDFSLGGPLRLGAFKPSELRGSAYALAVAGYWRKAKRTPQALGGDLHVGAWVESGSAFDAWRAAHWRTCLSGGVVLESFVGPIFAGASVGADGRGRLYIAVGHLGQ